MALLSKETRRRLILRVVPPLAYYWMNWFDKAARAEGKDRLVIMDPQELMRRKREENLQVLVAFWHNRMAFGPTAYRYAGGKKGAIMISRSFDGEVIAAVMDRFGIFEAVRGGSSRRKDKDKGGKEALEQMIEKARQGYDLFITPDGPQGPVYKVKPGVVQIAQATGLPIHVLAANCSRYLEATSWDKTRFPLPYAHFVYRAEGPIWVPKDADGATLEAKRQEVEKLLIEITEFVDHYYD